MKNDNILEEIQNPEKSIFVSANAGSGKTFILVARVLGLMLEGEEPSKILCISFTEQAATEMKERIKTQALKWHNQTDFKEDILLQNASYAKIERAKNLYKDVILQGKLPKILTFHSFCFEIINSFTPESGPAYNVSILSGSAEKIIKQDILKKLFLDDKIREILNEIKYLFSNHTIEKNIIPEILKIKEASFKDPHKTLSIPYFEGKIKEIIKSLEENFLKTVSFNNLNRLYDELETGSKKEQKLAENLKQFLQKPKVNLLQQALLTAKNEVLARPITKGTLEKSPFLGEIYEDEVFKLTEFIKEKNIISCAKVSENIIKLISEIGAKYKEAKERFESLDFDDLIIKTKTALYSENRDFILFKLDGGINHILIDEAQDTNFIQWEVLFAILEEFFSGIGAQRGKKSLFIVGDEKQSIFGFQGSEPEVLAYILKKYEKELTVLSLQKSYRTTPLILNLVDKIFKQIPEFKNYKEHISAKEGYGKVEVIPPPILEKGSSSSENEVQPEFWKMPWEREEKEILKEKVAIQIEAKILELIREGRKPCEIMLLSKSRDKKMFDILKEALQKHDIGISFGDEISLSESLPIQDFISLLKSLLNQTNTYALACTLRSPIFNVKDEDLEKIFLHKTLEVPPEFTKLKSLLTLPLESFFKKVILKFSHRYDENEIKEIAQIFTLINEYKKTGGNNFEGFVQFCEVLAKYGQSFKISFTEKENNIKINTVHGSKGLESPIVFILNATEVFAKKASLQYIMQKNGKFLAAKANMKVKEWEEIKEEQMQKDYEEYLRLLYVAMTRAKEELYIFAKEELKPATEFQSWYEIIINSMAENTLISTALPHLNEPENGLSKVKMKEFITLPAQTQESANNIKFIKATKNKTTETKNLILGSIIHTLLERQEVAKEAITYLLKKYPEISKEEIEELINISAKVKEKFPEMFSKNALSEVEITLKMNGEEPSEEVFFKGKIDKLIISETEVHIIDFKLYKEEIITEEIQNQIESYKKAIAKIYPHKKVRASILWLKTLICLPYHQQ